MDELKFLEGTCHCCGHQIVGCVAATIEHFRCKECTAIIPVALCDIKEYPENEAYLTRLDLPETEV